MTVRWITVTLGTKRAGSNQYEGATAKHAASQAGDVTIAWDDSVVKTKGDLIEGARIAVNQAVGTLPS